MRRKRRRAPFPHDKVRLEQLSWSPDFWRAVVLLEGGRWSPTQVFHDEKKAEVEAAAARLAEGPGNEIFDAIQKVAGGFVTAAMLEKKPK